jgi:tripartite-type tricarboxylate transporter receptor subunit TctC
MSITQTTRRVALGAVCAFAATTLAGTTAIAGGHGGVDMSGKTVEFVIPFSESGGSARWANFYAPLLSEALPGNPTVVVRYRPGAGSTAGANWFQEQDTNDGTLIFGTSGSTQFPYLLDDPRVRYEYNDWQVVLASGVGGVAYLPPDMAAKMDGLDATGLQGDDFIWGSQGATRLDLVANLAWKMLGMTVDPVFGIEGRGDGRLMFERGEANIDYQTSPAYLRSVVPLVEQGLAVPMMSWGALDDDGNIVRDPTFPDMPTFKEVCDATPACSTEGDAWDAWKAFFIAGFPAQKMVFLPQNADADVVATYSKAFQDVIARPDFAEKAAATLGIYPQMTEGAAQNAKDLATKVPPTAKAFVTNWLQEDYGVSLK